MLNLRLALGCLVFCLLAGWRVEAQPVYYCISSATSANTLDSVNTDGTGNTTLFTGASRCTAVAVDGLNGKLFYINGASAALGRTDLNGANSTTVKNGLTSFVSDLALDVLNEKIYYATTSTVQNNNTIQRVDYTGSNNVTLFTATGGSGVSRCTAIALDSLNSKIFIADAGAQKIWSMNLDGSGLTPLATNTASFPVGLALDVNNKLVYFASSSTTQSANLIQRVNYNGSGLSTIFTASGSVQRCTALDFDQAHNLIYLSDAGANTLWRIPTRGVTPTAVLSGLPATAKKVRWYGGPATRPPPGLVGFHLSGANMVFNATNGFVGGSYYVLTSTNLNSPLSQWLPISTNVLGATGPFSIIASNTFASKTPSQFYILGVQ